MKARVLAIMVLAAACTSGESGPTRVEVDPRPRAEPSSSETRVEAEVEAEADQVETPAREILSGPAQADSLEQRRAAVLAILTDGSTASHLSLDAGP